MKESNNNEFYTTAKSIIDEFNRPLILTVYEDVPSVMGITATAKYFVAIYDGSKENWFDNPLASAEISEGGYPMFLHVKTKECQYRRMVDAMDVISETCDRLYK